MAPQSNGLTVCLSSGSKNIPMRALLSVSDKTGIVDLARSLHDRGIEVISTGGTASAVADAGIPVLAVADVTGVPEMLDGRVKTLHPAIHGGLLARLELPEHRQQLQHAGIAPISILVSNLYPFEKTVASNGRGDANIVEQIDIGGPAMVRAGAKNFDHVYVVTRPDDYEALLNVLDASPEDQQAFRKALAAKAFGHVSTYDSLVSSWLQDDSEQFPAELSIGLRLAAIPRYGENPQQHAAAYRRLKPGTPETGILDAGRIAGQELSFNNYLDADAAWQAVQLFSDPAVAIVKHMVPCGLAVRDRLSDAYDSAFAGDPVSAFGGIVALNRTVDEPTAAVMRKIKLDIIIAPDFEETALTILRKKKNTRILKLPNRRPDEPHGTQLDVRTIGGGMLVQTPDTQADDSAQWTVVTKRAPTSQQFADMTFAWQVARLVKSNAIVFAKNNAIVGLGAGQPNRLESVAIAARKAGSSAEGAAMASDAFFPFPDGIETAVEAGVSAVIQPGGSMRDNVVIEAANEAEIAMMFTGTRHFRH